LTAAAPFDISRFMEISRAVGALGAMAQETRLRIFRTLVQRGPDGLPAGRIAAALDLPGPTLSFHLAQLKSAGLVSCRRDGRSLIYTADYAAIEGLVAYLTENCCGRGAACAPAVRSPVRARRARAERA
jgi:DNA-binding transcriptional ArsR family regulator